MEPLRPDQLSPQQQTPAEVEWNEEERIAYTRLRKITVHPSRLLAPKFMKTLGVYDDICEILRRMGLGFFIKFQRFHYPYAARQFYATLEVKYKNPKKKVG